MALEIIELAMRGVQAGEARESLESLRRALARGYSAVC